MTKKLKHKNAVIDINQSIPLCFLRKLMNHNEIAKAIKFLTFMLVCISVVSGNSCSSPQSYQDADLGITLNVPHDWKLYKDERSTVVELTPNQVDRNEHPVSITILRVAHENQELSVALQGELERLRQVVEVADAREMIMTRSPQEFFINGEEALKASFEIPLIAKTEAVDNNSSQQVELILIKRNGSLIVIHAYMSDNDQVLNKQVEEIIGSIKITN